jgi:hypothetical protein
MSLLQYLAMAVVILSAVNIWMVWGTPAVIGWVVAISGWLPNTLPNKGAK